MKFPENTLVCSWLFSGDKFQPLPGYQTPTEEVKPGLSVIVCTYKRAGSMSRLLKSLAESAPNPPDELIVVDASPDDATEQKVRQALQKPGLAGQTKYVRVSEGQRGLTRQRNLGIRLIENDLAIFFDDDVMLRPNNLYLLDQALRQDVAAIGAAAYPENEFFKDLPRRWRLRKMLGLWREEQIGYLTDGGLAVPQSLWPPFNEVRPVDIVPGCAMCWRTWVLRKISFDESFMGYGLAEDLEYSLRTRPLGKKLMVGEARVLHLIDPPARVSSYIYGKQGGKASAIIFRRYAPKSLKTRVKFFSSQLLDFFILITYGIRKPSCLVQALGRLMGLVEQLRDNN